MANKKASSKKASKVVSKKATEELSKVEEKVKTALKKGEKNEKSFLDEISKPSFISAVVLEFIGTFLLAAAVVLSNGQPITIMFALTAIVLIAGGISGAYVNPLLTVGAWVTRRINTVKAIFYIVAQVLGAMVAFMLLNAFVNASEVSQQAAQIYGQQKATLFTASVIPKDKEMLVLAAELIGSFIFAFSVATITADKKNNSTAKALGVGGSLFLAAFISSSLAASIQASTIINPAIAFTVQAFTVSEQNIPFAIAIYVGAALIGGILGFGLHWLIQKSTKEEK